MIAEKVGPAEIAEVIEAWTGIYRALLRKLRRTKLRMETELGKRLIGQVAMPCVWRPTLFGARVGPSDPNRPTGSLP